jgi:hypothetical protein
MSRNFRYPDLFEQAVDHFGEPPEVMEPYGPGGYFWPQEMQNVINDVFPLDLDGLPFPENENDALQDLWQGEAPLGRVSPSPSGVSEVLGANGAEALAWYVPFALSPAKWGIYFNGHHFPDYVAALAAALHVRVETLWPIALHQVRIHELTHFHFECVGTQLEITLRKRTYPSYVQHRYTVATMYGHGPLEEAIATERELSFARGVRAVSLPGDTGFRPRGYRQLLESVHYPPGYRDWGAVKSPAHRRLAYETLIGIITSTDLPLRTPERLWVPDAQVNSVPLYWWGPLDALPAGLRKSWSMPSIARLEKWLRRCTSCQTPTRGARHKQFTYPNGRTQPYKGSGDLLPPEGQQMAKSFGFRNLADFCEAVASMRPPPHFSTVDELESAPS